MLDILSDRGGIDMEDRYNERAEVEELEIELEKDDTTQGSNTPTRKGVLRRYIIRLYVVLFIVVGIAKAIGSNSSDQIDDNNIVGYLEEEKSPVFNTQKQDSEVIDVNNIFNERIATALSLLETNQGYMTLKYNDMTLGITDLFEKKMSSLKQYANNGDFILFADDVFYDEGYYYAYVRYYTEGLNNIQAQPVRLGGDGFFSPKIEIVDVIYKDIKCYVLIGYDGKLGIIAPESTKNTSNK